MKTLQVELIDRILRFDGVSIVAPTQVEDLLLKGASPAALRVTALDSEIQSFNAQVAEAEKLKLSDSEPIRFSYAWLLPDKYLHLDIEEHVQAVFSDRLSSLKYSLIQTEAALNRVVLELQLFQTHGLYDLLRAIVFVLDTFKASNQIWGVGRGSSCASYVLFILGLHVVDPILFDVPIEEFFHA